MNGESQMKKLGIIFLMLTLLVSTGLTQAYADTDANLRTISSSISVNPNPIESKQNVEVKASINGSAGDFQESNGNVVITIPKNTVAAPNELKPDNVIPAAPFEYVDTIQDENGDYQIIFKIDMDQVDENEAVHADFTINYVAPLFKEDGSGTFKIEYANTQDSKDVTIIGEQNKPDQLFYKWYQYSLDESKEVGLLDINQPSKNRFLLAVNYSQKNVSNVVVTDTLPEYTELTTPERLPGATGDGTTVSDIRILKVNGFNEDHEPTGFSYVTNQFADKISYNEAQKQIVVNFGDISSSEAYLVEYAIKSTNLDMGTQINTANLKADGYDLTREFPVKPLLASATSFSLKKSVNKSKINIGENHLEYKLEFGVKSGVSIPAGVKITDPVPDKMTITDVTSIDSEYFDYTVSEDGKILELTTKKEITADTPQTVTFAVDIDSLAVGDEYTNVGILHISGEELYTNSATTVVYDGRVQIIKVDKETKERLPGATFEILDSDGNKVFEGTTDENGELMSIPLEIGQYTIVETKAPEGYEISGETKSITITGDEKEPVIVQVDNTLITGSVELTKTDEKDEAILLAGAEFKLLDSDGNVIQENIVTDANGKILINNLKPGEYSFVETKAPAGYLLDETPIHFTIDKAQSKVLNLSVTNKKDTGSVLLTKVDKDDQKTVLSGAEFKLLDANGKEIETNLVTNEDGEIMVKDLAPGKYAFVETKAPKGYKLDETPVEFTIEKEQVEMIKVMKVNKKDSSNETDNDKDHGNGNGNNTNNNGDNNSNSKLPSTGDVTILLTILVGGFLIYLGSKELKKKQAK